jgi:hypothetical protein
MAADRDIAQVLGELGYGTDAALALARTHLESAGLTRPGKQRISELKLEALKDCLEQRFAVLCADPECARQAQNGRVRIPAVPLAACAGCHGSDNRRAFARIGKLCAARPIKLVVVGGSPSVREELRAGAPDRLELRLIDGTERRTSTHAQSDLEWADLIVVWGGSELDHKVSRLYTDAHGAQRGKVLQVSRRGVAALLNAAADQLGR